MGMVSWGPQVGKGGGGACGLKIGQQIDNNADYLTGQTITSYSSYSGNKNTSLSLPSVSVTIPSMAMSC